ncbi:MAG: hypothetical protein MAG431_02323 [Chloroflexi bacterium]|nr:hypothetical protein [Chloroflexota bacterium]
MILTVFILLAASVIISLALAFFAWRRRPTPGALEFTLLMLATAWWSLTLALELGVATLQAKIVWAKNGIFWRR